MRAGGTQFLLDCGASSLIAMRRFGVDSAGVVEAAAGADLFICEAYFFEKKIKYHLDYRTLMEQRARLGCQRLILTHMSHDMLERVQDLEVEWAEDGKVVSV